MSKKCRSTGKTRYTTDQDATKAMLHIYSRDPSAVLGSLEIYPCPFCSGIHIRHKVENNRVQHLEGLGKK